MKREILVDINPHQTRVALLENDEPAELYVERTGRERIVGNIYKGRVANVLPGMQAAFVDVGLEKNAFLFAGDINADKSDFVFPGNDKAELELSIGDKVKQGQEILLQVVKEPVGTKGARVTTHITLPGRTLVLAPTVDYIGVSRRIEDETERSRLREIMERIKPKGMGVIVRTAAAGKTEEEFAADVTFLSRMWQRVRERSALISAPRLIHKEEALVFRIIRDIFTPDVTRLVVNDEEYYERVKIVAGIISPELADRVEFRDETRADELFVAFDVESKLERMLARKVWLKNGAYIVIDHTEALTAIDVNTGKYIGSDDLEDTLFETNCEAAREIAKQLRLRDISGIIIIDFIDMEVQEHRDEVIEILKEGLKADRTKSNVVGMTGLGLVEMTRKKMRNPLSETLQIPCPYCKGEGRTLTPESVAHNIRRQVVRQLKGTDTPAFLIYAHPDVVRYMREKEKQGHPVLPKAEGRSFYITEDENTHIERFEIRHITDEKELSEAADAGYLHKS